MFQKQISRKLHYMYGLSNTILAMLCAIPFLFVEFLILGVMNSEVMSIQEVPAVIPPAWFCGLYGVVLLVLILHFVGQCFSDSWRELEDTTREDLAAGISLAKNAPRTEDSTTVSMLDTMNTPLDRSGRVTMELNGMRQNIRQVADHFGVRLPSGDRHFAVGFGIPVVIYTVLFACQIIPAHVAYNTIKTDSIAAIDQLVELTEPYTSRYFNQKLDKNNRPLEKMSFYAAGHEVSPFGGSSMRMSINAQGKVYELAYTADVNPELSPEENLRHAQELFSHMQEAFLTVKLPREMGDFPHLADLPEQFCQEFLKGDYSRELYFCNIDGGADNRTFCFNTDLGEGGSDCYISVYIMVL